MLARTLTWGAVLLFAGAAAAVEPPEPPEPYGGNGWYLGTQGVYAIEKFNTTPSFSGVSPVVANNAFGLNVHGGYRFVQDLAIDLEVEYIDGFAVRAPRPVSGTYRTWNVALNFKVYPLARVFEPGSPWTRVQPFVQGAPAWQWARWTGLGALSGNNGSFLGRVGGGADFYLTKKLSLTANAVYNFTTHKLDGLDYISIGWGFQYHFGVPEY